MEPISRCKIKLTLLKGYNIEIKNFKVANNPLSYRVLTGSIGTGKKGQIYTTGIFKLDNGQYKVAVNYKGKTYTVIKGDLLKVEKLLK